MSVVCGFGPLLENTYALSKSGKLCVFDKNRILEMFTEIKVCGHLVVKAMLIVLCVGLPCTQHGTQRELPVLWLC